jgi:hypothetical protein
MPWLKLRKIILTPEAQAEVDDACQKYPRFGEVWEGICWLLARNPQPVDCIPTSHLGMPYVIYGIAGNGDASTPELWLVYAITDEEVTIQGINAMEATEASDPNE